MRTHHRKLLRLIRRVVGKPNSGAEIGVFRGDTAATIAEKWPKCHMTFVDPWKEWPVDHPYYAHHKTMGRYTLEEWEKIYTEAVAQIQASGLPHQIYRMTGDEAAKLISPKSIDFIFLDASHSYEDVKRDIRIWTKKARKLICGHDYDGKGDKIGWGVSRAVNEIFGEKNVLKYHGKIWGVPL